MLIFKAHRAQALRDYDVYHSLADMAMGPHFWPLKRIGTVGGLYERLASMCGGPHRNYEKAFGDCYTPIYFVSFEEGRVEVYARAAPLAGQMFCSMYRHYTMSLEDGGYVVTYKGLVDPDLVQEARAAAAIRPPTARL